MKKDSKTQGNSKQNGNIFKLLKNYRGLIALILILTLAGNGINLLLPKIIASGIDQYIAHTLVVSSIAWQFFAVSTAMMIFAYTQNIVQAYTSEKVAKDLREKLTAKISQQSYSYVEQATTARLLTNLTSDIDATKSFVSQAIGSLISSLLLIIGTSIFLIVINWQLALAVLLIIPIIGAIFFFVFGRANQLFVKSQEVIDWLNKVISESVLGASLIRLLNSQIPEYQKFLAANTDAKNTGYKIVRLFAGLMPFVMFTTNMAGLTILLIGGHFVINGTMTLGNFAAFTSYLVILIFPLFVIGFTGNIISRSMASYQRISAILTQDDVIDTGNIKRNIDGDISIENITMTYDQKTVLDNISFTVKPKSRTAIIGPVAAGKTQLLYLLTGLIKPSKGTIKFDGIDVSEYDKTLLYKQIGFVFQDSIMFNMSIRENIAFNTEVQDRDLDKALKTAELDEFINTLPQQLDTLVSERGTTLSGGQKQRIMLARALAINPTILILDDFTARVDTNTEQRILENIKKNYPEITLISVTQKIAPIENYDNIILLMDGEIIAQGKHEYLLKTSPEYVQIYNSQRSTNHYELQA